LRANSGETLRRAALADLGIIFAPTLLVHDDSAAGRLTPLLEAFAPKARPMHLLTLADRRPPGTVRTFVSFVLARLATAPGRRTATRRDARAG
jgi:DNA-binding transcriptional LysR family regulator